MKDEISFPRFISDKPLGIDLFEGESHDKIAASIASYITYETDNIKLIGLEGAWGSGKSNVIEILKNKYLKDTHQIFVFDAWGHQEDLQRRAILEELTSSLIESGTLPEKTTIENSTGKEVVTLWKDLLKNLLARKREIQTKEIPNLSTGLVLIISTIILTPIFKTIGELFDFNQYLKILITAFPFIVCSIWFLILLTRRTLTFSELYAIYNNKKLENTIIESISEKEPTVNEFRRWMEHLSRDLTANNKKLLIVFDNMDRLLPVKVKALWSSIHTFFAECNYTNIWVIVPFDSEQIKDAFQDSVDTEKATHFIKKTFSAIYRVSPPILTDWHRLFEMKYKEAFGETENNEYDIVKSTFDLTQRNITPRNIITFINDLVSEKKLVGCDVSLRYIAVFSVFKKAILADPVNQILNPTFLGNLENLYKDDAKLPDSIASLVYNLPFESAKQITLTQHLKSTLNDKDIKVINDYAKQKHFLEMLEKVVNQEELQLENTIITIGSIEEDLLKKLNPHKMNVIWDTLCGKQISKSINNQEFTESLKLLLINSSPDKKEKLVRYFVNQVAIFKDFKGGDYFYSLRDIIELVKSNSLKLDVYSFLDSIIKPPEIFLDFVNQAKEKYSLFKLTCIEDELITYVNSKIPNEIDKLPSIQYLTSDFNFEAVLEHLVQCIEDGKTTVNNLLAVFDLYKTLSKERPIQMLADDEIHTLISSVESNSPEYYELVSMRLSMGDEFSGTYNTGILLKCLSQVDELTVSEVAKRIEWYSNLNDLLTIAIETTYPLLISVIKYIISTGVENSTIDIEENISRSDDLVETLSIGYDELLKFYNCWAAAAQEKITKDNIGSYVTDIQLIEHATKIDNDFTNHIIGTYLSYQETISIEEWSVGIRNGSSFKIKALYYLIVGEKLKELPDNIISAYKDYLMQLAKGQILIEPSDFRSTIIEKINKNKLKPTIKNIRDAFINDVNITPEVFMFFAEMLREDGKLGDKPDDVTRRILTPVAADENCLRLIIKHTDFWANIIANAGDDSSDFKDIIRQTLQTSAQIEGIEFFAERIGVDRNKEA
jgi:hypothetical protein